jgi:UDP-N-acetylglucosamine acyltransferase
MNCGSQREKSLTKIEDDCMFMVAAHVAHDCAVGKKCIFANNASLGGHVKVGDQVFMGGFSAVHQFCEIGEHAIVGAMSFIRGHVIPYGNVVGNKAYLQGVNLIGLERRGFSKSDIRDINNAYRTLFLGKGVFSERIEQVAAAYSASAHVQRIIEFIRTAAPKRQLTHAEVQHA